MADYGLSNALAFRTNASDAVNSEINDLKYAQQQRKENEAMATAKQNMLLGDIEFQNGSNPYDAAIIKDESQKLISDLGRITRENPDWTTNPAIGAQIKLMKQQLKSTPAVLRSLAYKDAMGQYNKYLQEAIKNHNKYNLDQLDSFKRNIDAYGKDENGNWLPSDVAKPLVFTPPAEIPDLEKRHNEAARMIDPDEYQKWNNGMIGAFKGRVSDKSLYDVAKGMYEKDKGTYDYVYKNNPDKIGAIMSDLRPRTKTDVRFGEVDDLARQKALALFKHNLESTPQKPGESTYDKSFLNTDHVYPGKEILSEVYTTTPPNFYIDVNGNKVNNTMDDFHYNGDLTDQGFANGKGGKQGQRTGIKEATGYIAKDLDWAKQNGYLHDPTGFSGNEDTDLEVRPEHRGKGEIVTVTGKDGKPKSFFKLYANAVIDARNPIYKQRVDKGMAPKLRVGAGVATNLEDGGTPQVIQQNGFTYTFNPSTGKYE